MLHLPSSARPARAVATALAGLALLTGCTAVEPPAQAAPVAPAPASSDPVAPPIAPPPTPPPAVPTVPARPKKPAAPALLAVPQLGADIGWPNCPKGMGIATRRSEGQPLPLPSAQYVVLGLTNGPAFTPNPCLAAQVEFARSRRLWVGAYAVSSYPTKAQLRRYGGAGSLRARLQRVGRAEAAYTIRQMRAAKLDVPLVWVDVETVSGFPWGKPADSNALIEGVVAEYAKAGYGVGIYSYPTAWRRITGGRPSPLPNWVPAGRQDRKAALSKCSAPGFTGGPVWLGQWTDGRRDYNVTCPSVTPAIFAKMFRRPA